MDLARSVTLGLSTVWNVTTKEVGYARKFRSVLHEHRIIEYQRVVSILYRRQDVSIVSRPTAQHGECGEKRPMSPRMP
jgi:hypothetical protein